MPCLDEPTVVAFVAGHLAGAEVETIDDHLADCQSCRDLVVWAAKTTLAIGSQRDVPAAREAASGGERYAIEALIGIGGQGLVYAAKDTVLGRTVALKVLHARRDDQILGEARLVAKLNHPNIVAVYDAGTTRDGAIYLAMERVASSLPEWRAGKTASEVLRACLDAGHGLAAAHAASIIHRDIKPSNILIGSEGRARVTDFGLALEEGGAGHGLAGTLAYMAPEQLDGQATAASDQFSLAVAIWESLTDRLPFAGSTVNARRQAIASGPGPAQLPRHVGLALRRALAADPSARFPNVATLVAALSLDPKARRTRRLLIGGTVTAVGAAVLAIAFAGTHTGPSCTLGESLEGVWDEPAKAHLASGFAALKEPYAARAMSSVTLSLDRYARAWIAAKTHACEARESDSLYALRTQCLDERRAALAAAVHTLSAPDAEIARHALEIADGLPGLAPCADTTWLTQRVRPPTDPATIAKVASIETSLAESATAMRAGKIKSAIEIARRAVAASTAIDHAPTRARAQLALGEAQAHLPDNDAAEAALEQATQWAQRGRDDRVAAEAFIELVKVVGHGLGHYDEALREAGFADATLARLGDDPNLRATLDYHRCAVFDQLARFAEAEKSCAAALAARVAAFGTNDASTADVLILQARLATNQAKYKDAVGLARRALAVREQAFGPNHPILVEALFALGQVEVRLGMLDDAAAHYERAMQLALPTFGEDSSVIGSLWAERSVIASMRGDLPAALAAIDRSTAIREHIGGPEHVDLVFNLTARGRILDDSGKPKEAVATLGRALEIAERAYGKDHPSIAAILQDLGRLHAKLGDPKAAQAELDRAIAIAVRAHDKNGEAAGESALAEMLHAAGRPRDAVPHYEKALATYEALLGGGAPQLIATLENLALAQVDLKQPALALPLLDRAIALESKTSGPASPRLITPLDSRGDAELALGQRAKAKATWQQALALPNVEKFDPEDTKDVQHKLARLLSSPAR